MSGFSHTREWLDRQYDLRAAVTDRQQFADLWASQSTQARADLDARLDLPYGPSDYEKLDFFLGIGPNSPLVVFFHGGYWRANDKRDFGFPAAAFVPNGIAFASANYALAPGARIETMVGQARRAVQWLARNCRELGIDRRRIFVAGHSAGGHLATMVALTDWEEYGLDFNPVRGAISISGLYDLEPLRQCFLNDVIQLDEASARRNSPLAQLDAADPEIWRSRTFLFCVGGKETEEFRRQQSDFVDAWSGRAFRATVVEEPDCHHYDVVLKLGDPEGNLFRSCLSLVREADATV